MFEPGNIYMPVSSHGYAMKCKQEIEQILYVIDLLDVYEADSSPRGTTASPLDPPAPVVEETPAATPDAHQKATPEDDS